MGRGQPVGVDPEEGVGGGPVQREVPHLVDHQQRGPGVQPEALQPRPLQVRGVQGMVEDDRWCPDILQQIAAIQSALNKVALGLADGHVQHCMAESTDPARREEMSAELMQALGRLVR